MSLRESIQELRLALLDVCEELAGMSNNLKDAAEWAEAVGDIPELNAALCLEEVTGGAAAVIASMGAISVKSDELRSALVKEVSK